MRKVILYSALSLDGYIATPDGSIDWLFSDGDEDYGYTDFLAGIDTLLMGYHTFKQVLDFGPWPYEEQRTYVFSRRHEIPESDHFEAIREQSTEFVREMREQTGKDIWLVGGGQLNGHLYRAGLIDQMILSVHPVFLGRGIPLLPDTDSRTTWKTEKVETFASGLVQWTINRPDN